jgi:hypothetical protein
MKKSLSFLLLTFSLIFTLNNCSSIPSATPPPAEPGSTLAGSITLEPSVSSTITRVQSPTPLTPGKMIVVDSTADSGLGTMRKAILEARPGDIITFDTAVFLPDNPATIFLTSSLPSLNQGFVTIDDSNAGVILDGSDIGDEWHAAIEIKSNGNIIRGLQLQNFLPGAGIVISGGGQFNIIRGDPSLDTGPLGQGNQVILSGTGIGLWGEETRYNTISGNFLGTDTTGTYALENNSGIVVSEGASYNLLGPANMKESHAIVA